MKIGIIGLGDGGRCNLKSLRAIGADVVAVCDHNEQVMESAKKEVGDAVSVYSDVQGLLDRADIELVLVATPDDQHLDPTEKALEAGKRVFVEKPVATNIRDVEKFEGLVRKYPHRVLFSEKYSFAHPVQTALTHRRELGEFLCGTTLYTMWKCDRIMGGGKWRTECAYNPCAGGLSHNFMTALLFVCSPIVRVRATGKVLTYHENLDLFGGFDIMEGTLEFAGGQQLNWLVCLAVKGADSLFGHRTVAHMLQFEKGSLAYGPTPSSDRLIVDGKSIAMPAEPDAEQWGNYNINVLYSNMHRNVLAAQTTGEEPLHTIVDGINVAYACCLAFESAKQNGEWIQLPGGT